MSIVATSAAPTAVIRETTTWERFPTLWRELLDEVWGYVRGAEVQAGRNVMLYLDDVPTVEVGVELEGALRALGPRRGVRAAGGPRRDDGRPRRSLTPRASRRRTPRSSNGATPTATPRTGVRWEVYDHWRDDPDSFETAVYWLLAS